MPITASQLYAFIQCPHRVWRDANDDPAVKDSVNEFVQMLWERGTQYEEKVIIQHKKDGAEVLDLSEIPHKVRFAKTIEAMNNKVPYIYQGRLEIDNIIGEPDLLELQDDGEYLPMDIKSGMGTEGEDDEKGEQGKLKSHYALQIALYVDALQRLGFTKKFKGYIWDSAGNIVEYDLTQSKGKRDKTTWWQDYKTVFMEVENLVKNRKKTKPALSSNCGLCQWYSTCKKQCIENNDVSLICGLGRSKQENLESIATKVSELAKIKIEDLIDKKGDTGIKGIGEKTLTKFHRRAKLQDSKTKEPLILEKFYFPDKPIELFFDIETDPTRDIVYMHGIVERRKKDKSTCKFHAFTAEDITEGAERKAFKEFWDYIRSLPENSYIVYYYSKYERTQYRNLAKKYPDIVSEDEVEIFFSPEEGNSIDLYFDIVNKYTEWSTYNYSVKSIAQHLGFKWRDAHPSGAASIQWFNEWCKDKNPKKLQRILDYNEDDCMAMIVIKDYLENLINN